MRCSKLRRLPTACGLLITTTTVWLAANEPLQFNRDIRPILSDNCYACHGPDAAERKADLRLDLRETAVASGAIVPGAPEKSVLIQRIQAKDPEEVMPPAEHRKRLLDGEKQRLRDWIAQGAAWEDHWAYRRIKRAALPQDPEVQHPVDAFIRRQIKRSALAPSPPADTLTLIRRLHLDLLGLPPSPEAVARWSQEFHSAKASYSALVDTLLASPAFGERMAIGWLDLVRYADSNGYHADLEWSVSPYRDYVIEAFNTNKPFDVFTREQIAGDLLPNAGLEQKIAAGFHRLNMKSTEFGIQDKEYLAKYQGDRIRTTATTWLGSTLGCAECHDHKFDPFLASDYYQFGAFFADIKSLGYYPDAQRKGWGERFPVPPREQWNRFQTLEAEIAALEADLLSDRPGSIEEQMAWEKTALSDHATALSPTSREAGQEWAYTTTAPRASWMESDFDDSRWKRGVGVFGSKETPNVQIRTSWRGQDIWLRRAFELNVPIPPDVHLAINHDEDAEVYLNGKLIGRFEGYSARYISKPLDPDDRALLAPGRNILAVHCRQTTGGQCIDLGLLRVPVYDEATQGFPKEIHAVLMKAHKARSPEEAQRRPSAHWR